jgi:hypothetical protein
VAEDAGPDRLKTGPIVFAVAVLVVAVIAYVVVARVDGHADSVPHPGLTASNQSKPAPVGSWELTHSIDLPAGWQQSNRVVAARMSTSDLSGRLSALLPNTATDDFVWCSVTVQQQGERMRARAGPCSASARGPARGLPCSRHRVARGRVGQADIPAGSHGPDASIQAFEKWVVLRPA